MVTNKKALVVGINEYDGDKIQNLGGCINDANAIKELLENHEDREWGKNIHVESHSNLRTNDLKEAICRFLKEKSKLAVIFFAGHGYIDEDGGYLMCKDANKRQIGVEMGWLNKQILDSEIEEIIIILDCCHAGNFGSIKGANTEVSQLKNGVTILASSTKKQTSKEETTLENGKIVTRGLFTKIISEGLRGAAADLNGEVTTAALYRHAEESLSVIQQRPVFKSSVDEMTTLRRCKPSISREILKKIISKRAFSTIDEERTFYPSDIPDHKSEEKLNDFVLLSKFEKAGLIECEGQMTLIEAALRSKSCRLNMKGRFMWNKVKNDNY